ncbi:MAG: hypothetical protein QNL62_25600 [Gammaproteobacteria bacterium]|nr:hypothetical protein [Gammaproteobacteria bacterium]
MQFSVYDLQRQQIEIQNTNDEIYLIDLTLDNSAEILGSLLSGDLNYVDLLYDLTGSDVDALEFFGPDREIILSLGAEEVEATVTPGGTVRFENSQSLDLLERDDYLLISLYLNNDSANVLWEFAFEKIHLIADMNNDGQIIKTSAAKNDTDFIDTINSTETPFLFWINNDDDAGEVSGGKGSPGDIPNEINPDYANNNVDGMRDLVDFFPVYIDIKSAINSFPPADYTYRLMHLDSALKFTETNLVPISTIVSERVDAPLKHPGMAASLANATVTTITNTGVELSTKLINDIQDNKGIILIEATKATKEPLRLEVINKSNQRLAARAELALNIDNVETMYRSIDLKPLATRGDPPEQGLPENIKEPTNNKDDRTQPNYLAFIHGFKVSPEAARGWNAELFKRYHRLGFNGRFIATNWHGNTGLDYHNAVYNAFQTGMGLKTALNNAIKKEPGPITIAAHSLGNVVASNAISYGSLTPAKYFMINAASPIEAYGSAQDTANNIIMKDNMTEVSWKDYPEALYTANWHKLFAGNPLDNRNQLTWKNHFIRATSVAYNFYSPGDEVVENANANERFSATLWNNLVNVDFEQHTWVMQEMGKGCKGLISWFVFKCSGGWEFNLNQNDFEFIGKTNPDYDPVDNPIEFISYENGLEATAARDNNTLTNENLAQYGFFFKFNHFENNESEYSYLYQPIANAVLLQSDQHQWDLLASGIPTMSFAAAANPMDAVDDTDVGGKDRNFNMETLRGTTPAWPTERSSSSRQKNWLHSDIRGIALPYVYQTLDTMLVLGDFKE